MSRRSALAQRVFRVLRDNPASALVGPCQCGKTTLARELAARRSGAHFFDLETARDRRQLTEPERTWFVYPGAASYRIHERVEVVPLKVMVEMLAG